MPQIQISKPSRCWLFGGVGFHNSEATMSPIMSESFKNERVLKTFREVAPTFSRVFAGYANWTKEAMDAFADYYDQTFRPTGTLLYMVPGRLPMITEDFDLDAYCENVAIRLKYLVNERNCTKLRYYCVTNELSVGNTYAFLAKDLPLFKKLHEGLNKAFRRHGLDIGLLATDCSGTENFDQITWAIANMDEVTEAYCTHLYVSKYTPGDLGLYRYFTEAFEPLVEQARKKEKRFVLGEYGLICPSLRTNGPMRNDVCYSEDVPSEEGLAAIALCEMAMAAINVGCFATVLWTMFDYPEPFIRENGDTPQEKAKYDVARFSGHGLAIRYNKHGLIRWNDEDHDYSARASLYTMGHMARLFKKGSRVLHCTWDNAETMRCAAVSNADGSVSIAVINWAAEKAETTIDVQRPLCKPFRVYEFAADRVPKNRFNDLQTHVGTVCAENGTVHITLPPRSIVFLTTDYVERTPSAITQVQVNGDRLTWAPCTDEAHCYYRVFAAKHADFKPSYENQIASTVAETINITDPALHYRVLSVDQYGNTREE